MNRLSDLMALPMFNSSPRDWLLAALTAAAILMILLLARSVIRREHRKLLATEKTELLEIPLEVASKTSLLFMVGVAVFVAIGLLDVSERTHELARSALVLIALLQAGAWVTTGVLGWIERKQRDVMHSDRAAAGSLGVIGFIARAAVWAMVILLALDNLGVNITALVTGLGIGGVAVALALQNVLGDLFASLSITFDRPFVIGDFLVMDDIKGTVEHIGIKSIRLRSLGGEQIILGNAEMLKMPVRNFGRMNQRRVVFTLGVTYQTSADTLAHIPELIKSAIQTQDNARFDRCHFSSYGAFSLDFETVYYVPSGDFTQYMDIQQAINLAINRKFAELRIEFAFPTQTLFLSRESRNLAQPARALHGNS